MNRPLRYLTYALSFALLSGISGYVTLRLLTAGMTVTAPDIKGRSLAEADRSLELAGLRLRVKGEAYDASTEAGNIIGQDAEAGSTLKKGSEVNVTVSKGPERRLIPLAVGLSSEEAQGLLRGKGIGVGKIVRVHSEILPEGTVMAQKPSPEEWAGESVSLIVSKGPYDVIYYCPKFEGLTVQEAVGLAEELGLKASVAGRAGPRDAVSGQKPGAGSMIRPAETVYLQF